MRLPSRLPYSPLLRDCCGADSDSDELGRVPPVDGRLAGRFGALRTVTRGRDTAVRDRDMVERDLPGDESPDASLPEPDIGMPGLAAVDLAAVRVRDVDRDVVRDVVRGLAVVDRRTVAPATGFADCMVLAAVISALAAEVIALVAVFIACIADDIVFAEAVAFVAAAVILVAADVTFVAADDTPLAAVAGVVALVRLVVLRRVVVLRVVPVRLGVLRPPAAVLRRVVAGREAVDRDAVLRVDRDAVLRVVVRDAVVRGLAVVLRLADDIPADVLEPDMDDDRLAVPRDALRLTGLLRAELAELRRVAARVVD